MTCILTVDDSRAIRQVVTRQLADLAFTIEEAEDGEDGLRRLEEHNVDLILLDVTMPVLDGVGMLEKLRASGNKTPVIMLTSESKRSIIATAMKLGIDDYILKPFKQEELRAKVLKALRLDGAMRAAQAAGPAVSSAAAPEPLLSANAAGADASRAQQFVDVLVVDDMENVSKKLRTILPAHMTVNNASGARDALALVRDHIYRVILVDSVIPDVDSVALAQQLKAFQPHAPVLSLMLRSTNNPEADVKEAGYAGFLFKPFDGESIDQFLQSHFDNQELLTVENNTLRLSSFTGKEDRLERYFQRMPALVEGALEKLASACHDEVELDVRKMPVRPDRVVRLMVAIEERTSKMGMSLKLIATAELAKVFGQFTDTARIPLTVAEGKAA